MSSNARSADSVNGDFIPYAETPKKTRRPDGEGEGEGEVEIQLDVELSEPKGFFPTRAEGCTSTDEGNIDRECVDKGAIAGWAKHYDRYRR